MIARLYIDGEERGQLPISESGVSLELFGVEFPSGYHSVTITVSSE